MKFTVSKEEHVNKTFRLPKKLVNDMYKICDTKGVSLNRLAQLCIEFALENFEDEDVKINNNYKYKK